MTFRELATANLARCEETFHSLDSWSPSDWAMATAGELGEACNQIKKQRRLATPDINQLWNLSSELTGEGSIERIGEELADTMIYLDLLAQRCGVNLEEAVRQKFNSKSLEVGSGIFL